MTEDKYNLLVQVIKDYISFNNDNIEGAISCGDINGYNIDFILYKNISDLTYDFFIQNKIRTVFFHKRNREYPIFWYDVYKDKAYWENVNNNSSSIHSNYHLLTYEQYQNYILLS